MAEVLLDTGHDGVILSYDRSCPANLAPSFLASLVNLDIQDVIIPIEFSFSKLIQILKAHNILFDFIFLSDSLDSKSAKNHLELWYPFLKNEGFLVGESLHPTDSSNNKKHIYHAFFGDNMQEVDDFLIVKK